MTRSQRAYVTVSPRITLSHSIQGFPTRYDLTELDPKPLSFSPPSSPLPLPFPLLLFLYFPSCPYMKSHIGRKALGQEKNKIPRRIVWLVSSLPPLCVHSCKCVPGDTFSLRQGIYWLGHRESACPSSPQCWDYKPAHYHAWLFFCMS